MLTIHKPCILFCSKVCQAVFDSSLFRLLSACDIFPVQSRDDCIHFDMPLFAFFFWFVPSFVFSTADVRGAVQTAVQKLANMLKQEAKWEREQRQLRGEATDEDEEAEWAELQAEEEEAKIKNRFKFIMFYVFDNNGARGTACHAFFSQFVRICMMVEIRI